MDIVFTCIAVIGVTGLYIDWGLQRIASALIQGHAANEILQKRPNSPNKIEGIILPLLLLTLWSAISHSAFVDPLLIPAPSLVAITICHGIENSAFTTALSHSLLRMLCGGTLGILARCGLGTLLSLSSRAETLFNSTLSFLRHIALFAWLPLITAW